MWASQTKGLFTNQFYGLQLSENTMIFFSAILFIWVFFGLYIIVMGAWRARLSGRLTFKNNPLTFVVCYPYVVLGIAADIIAQYTLASLVFLDPPRWGEHLVTDRFQRYIARGEGWRYEVAKYICNNALDIFDPRGDHC